MKHIKVFSFIVVLSFIFCGAADAAKQEFRMERINFDVQRITGEDSTISGLSKGKLKSLGKPMDWGIIKAVYESLPPWADDVELRYYVLLKSKRDKEQIMLVGSIAYIDVENGKHHISSIYIPPQVLRRYGEVSRIRAEIWYNGILQDAKEWPKDSSKVPWWTRIKGTYGVLLNRFYTPFEHEQQMQEELIKIQ